VRPGAAASDQQEHDRDARAYISSDLLGLAHCFSRVATRLCFPGSDVTARPVNEAARAIFVVVAHPVSHIVVRAVLVAAFGREVEIHVRTQHLFVSPAVAGICMKDVAVLVLVENADAGELLDRGRDHLVVVVDLASRDVLVAERNMIVEVEVALIRGDPIEALAHTLLVCFKVRQWRA
jgi:hypothetical protein